MKTASGTNYKITLVPSKNVKNSNTNQLPSTASTAMPTSYYSAYNSVPENNEFEDGIIDELEAAGKIQINDELYLIGDGTNTPFFSPKAIAFLVANFVFIVLSFAWLAACDYQIDFISTTFIALSAWTLGVNVLMALRMFRHARKQCLLAEKADDFRDYVRRVKDSSTLPPSSIIRNSSESRPSSYFLANHSQISKPVFV